MKDCPFCGANNSRVQTDASGGYAGRWEWAECGNCGARGPEVRIDNDRPGQYARDQWEKRPAPPAVQVSPIPPQYRSPAPCSACGDQHQVGYPCPNTKPYSVADAGPTAFRGRNGGTAPND